MAMIKQPHPYYITKHLAELKGLNDEQFSRWCNGRVMPSLSSFLKWREAVGLRSGRKVLAIASEAQKLELKTYLDICKAFERVPFED